MDFKGVFQHTNYTTAIPAGNNTLPNSLTLKYVYIIVGIYSVVLTVILIIITIIAFKKLRDCLYPPSYIMSSGYGTIQRDGDCNCTHRQDGELNPVVDDFERSVESEFDNVSLNHETYESLLHRAKDVPPDYEDPPAYDVSV
ncbi:hypothetical protein JTE90_014037 [Oedothorax gibbosus]|uniref:Uncharacterized protein n=1 Tax=Oedothorax gibbosus TaxID=931172 RepID=A0AAV6V1B7_9ARAC|nr:hypothetical protein JTE90_014037 [Oedothorax gibbosus]